MDSTVSMILSLLCGVALFLYGMSAMSDGLKKVAGNKMELILYKLTNSPLKGFLLGTAVTCVIQSSSATTVMVVGFVNSGMMKVSQAIGVILGANIGTSITGWVVCMSYIDGGGWASYFSSATITAVMAIIGICWHTFSKKDVYKHAGDILMGFAVLMTGMSMMSGAVEPLRTNPVFINSMSALNNPLLAIGFGILFAGILQSSSAAVGVVQALSTTGVLTFQAVFPILLGIGIGASFPVLLAAIGANESGKRTAYIYLIVSVISMIMAVAVYYPIEMVTHSSIAEMVMDPFSTAGVNTLYRGVTMTLMLPFVKQLKALVYRLIPASESEKEDMGDFDMLEERLLTNPTLACEQADKVMDGMARKAEKNVRRSLDLMDHYTPEGYKKVCDLEHTLNKYEEKLGRYLVKITGHSISVAQGQNISKSLQAIGDYEAIGDYAKNIADTMKGISEKKQQFSLAATDELTVIAAACEETIEITVRAFKENDPKLARNIFPLRELIYVSSNEVKKRHIKRLAKGECSMEMGFAQNDLLNNMQHIADHCANIGLDIIKQSEQNFNLHRFLNKYTNENKSEYSDKLHDYEVKYSI